MRVLVIGATGTIGRAVTRELEPRHEILRASRNGPLTADLTDPASLDALLAGTGPLDAVVCCAASGPLVPLTDLDAVGDAEFAAGLHGKLLGQIALTRRAATHLAAPASLTLTAGTFPGPLPDGSLGALVNSALEGFVRNAAHELPPGVRLNAVSPGWVRETLGSPTEGTPAAQVARVYADLVEGDGTGEVVRV
ncbi:short chain dehydrogenase [Streptomyces roseirectus]|uniref:Short chain dehydrogenase n=1 Tax=Streptomyces roseirectus TaxID=2768066 RepID=A0A7H0I9Y9_9ACTN|nr:short chain dehydrogenase [Streptomyces roseirectus]QNP69605.1 short chain dehydrogenase [Streptomyces roseirectus]